MQRGQTIKIKKGNLKVEEHSKTENKQFHDYETDKPNEPSQIEQI